MGTALGAALASPSSFSSSASGPSSLTPHFGSRAGLTLAGELADSARSAAAGLGFQDLGLPSLGLNVGPLRDMVAAAGGLAANAAAAPAAAVGALAEWQPGEALAAAASAAAAYAAGLQDAGTRA